MKVIGIPFIIDALGTVHQSMEKELEELENQWENREHPNKRIVKIGKNSGDLKRLAVS